MCTDSGVTVYPHPVWGLFCFLCLETLLDLCFRYNRWRICCDRHVLLKWQHLQALYQDEPMALGRGGSPPASLLPLLPLSLSLLTLLQAVLRVMVAIR